MGFMVGAPTVRRKSVAQPPSAGKCGTAALGWKVWHSRPRLCFRGVRDGSPQASYFCGGLPTHSAAWDGGRSASNAVPIPSPTPSPASSFATKRGAPITGGRRGMAMGFMVGDPTVRRKSVAQPPSAGKCGTAALGCVSAASGTVLRRQATFAADSQPIAQLGMGDGAPRTPSRYRRQLRPPPRASLRSGAPLLPAGDVGWRWVFRCLRPPRGADATSCAARPP